MLFARVSSDGMEILTQNNLKTLGMVFVLNKVNMILMAVEDFFARFLRHPVLAVNEELVLAQNVTTKAKNPGSLFSSFFVVVDSVLESKLFV